MKNNFPSLLFTETAKTLPIDSFQYINVFDALYYYYYCCNHAILLILSLTLPFLLSFFANGVDQLAK